MVERKFRGSDRYKKKPLSAEEKLNKENRIKYQQKRGAIVHELLDAVFDSFTFNIPFSERLNYKFIGGRFSIVINMTNKLGSGEFYLDNPMTYDDVLGNVLPMWNKLKYFKREQIPKRYNERLAEIRLAWDGDPIDAVRSGIYSCEDFVLCVRELFRQYEALYANERELFERVLGKFFGLTVETRRYDAPQLYKYVCGNAFVSSLYRRSKDEKDDITVNKIKEKLAEKYPGYNITVGRLGSFRNGVPKSIIVSSSGPIDIKWLENELRYAGGQRVYWKLWQPNNDSKREEKSEETLLHELKNTKTDIFKQTKPFILTVKEKNEDLQRFLQCQYKTNNDGAFIIKGKDSIRFRIASVKGVNELQAEIKAFIEEMKGNLNKDVSGGDINSQLEAKLDGKEDDNKNKSNEMMRDVDNGHDKDLNNNINDGRKGDDIISIEQQQQQPSLGLFNGSNKAQKGASKEFAGGINVFGNNNNGNSLFGNNGNENNVNVNNVGSVSPSFGASKGKIYHYRNLTFGEQHKNLLHEVLRNGKDDNGKGVTRDAALKLMFVAEWNRNTLNNYINQKAISIDGDKVVMNNSIVGFPVQDDIPSIIN